MLKLERNIPRAPRSIRDTYRTLKQRSESSSDDFSNGDMQCKSLEQRRSGGEGGIRLLLFAITLSEFYTWR